MTNDSIPLKRRVVCPVCQQNVLIRGTKVEDHNRPVRVDEVASGLQPSWNGAVTACEGGGRNSRLLEKP